ncbi:MAG: tetratricopeptide repeat protein [Bacteroidota bacterium]
MRILTVVVVYVIVCLPVVGQVSEEAKRLFHKGYYYLSIDNGKAAELLSQSIQLDSMYKDAYFHRGISYFKIGKYQSALYDFDRAFELDPSLHIIWMYKGFAYRNMGELENALSNFSQYIINNPTDTTAYSYILRGKMKYELGDFDGAVEDYDMAVKLKPIEEKYHYYKFVALYEAKQYKKALQSATKLIETTPDFYGYYFYKGNVYYDLGFYDSAVYMYNVAIIKNYQNADSYFFRALSYQAAKKYEKALEDYNTAIVLNNEDGYYFSERGNCKYAMGNKAGACEDWDVAGNLGYYEDFEKVKRLCSSSSVIENK